MRVVGEIIPFGTQRGQRRYPDCASDQGSYCEPIDVSTIDTAAWLIDELHQCDGEVWRMPRECAWFGGALGPRSALLPGSF